jgi:hypothetical protein
MEEGEGPSTRVVTVYDCLGCKWLDRRLIKPKRMGNPEYQNNCSHPGGLLRGSSAGRYIGPTTRTPGWCPVLKEDSNAAD